MKIGMNMLLWTNYVTEQHFGIFEELKKTGFDGCVSLELYNPEYRKPK